MTRLRRREIFVNVERSVIFNFLSFPLAEFDEALYFSQYEIQSTKWSALYHLVAQSS